MKPFLALAVLAAFAIAEEKEESTPADAWATFRAAVKEGRREQVWACFTAGTHKELAEGDWSKAFRDGQKLPDEDAVTVAGYLGFKDVAEFKAAGLEELAWHILTAQMRDLGWLAEDVHLVVAEAGEKTTTCRFEKDDKLSGWLVMTRGENGWQLDFPATRELFRKKQADEAK